MTARYRTSAPDHWTNPRPYQDADLRKQTYGALQPMEKPRWWQFWRK